MDRPERTEQMSKVFGAVPPLADAVARLVAAGEGDAAGAGGAAEAGIAAAGSLGAGAGVAAIAAHGQAVAIALETSIDPRATAGAIWPGTASLRASALSSWRRVGITACNHQSWRTAARGPAPSALRVASSEAISAAAISAAALSASTPIGQWTCIVQ